MRLYPHALLTVAIATFTTVASIVDATLVRPWRVNGFADVYTVAGLSWPPSQDRVEFWTRASAFEPLTYLETGRQRARIGERAYVLGTIRASSGLLTLLQASPVAGRLFVASDYEPTAIPVAIISGTFSARAFPSNEEALSATLDLLGKERRIVGVTTASASYRDDVDVWLPRTPQSAIPQYPPEFRKDEWLGKLGAGISAAGAHDQLVSLQTKLVEQAVGTNTRFDGVIVLRPLLTDLLIRGEHLSTFLPLIFLAIGLLVLSWSQVLRSPHRSRTSDQPASPKASILRPSWTKAVGHPITRAIAIGTAVSWFWEQDAVGVWLQKLLPPSAATPEVAGMGWGLLVAAAVALLVAVLMLGCARGVAFLGGYRASKAVCLMQAALSKNRR